MLRDLWLTPREENQKRVFRVDSVHFHPRIRTSKNELNINVLRALTIKHNLKLSYGCQCTRSEIPQRPNGTSRNTIIITRLWRKPRRPDNGFLKHFEYNYSQMRKRRLSVTGSIILLYTYQPLTGIQMARAKARIAAFPCDPVSAVHRAREDGSAFHKICSLHRHPIAP